MNIGFTQFIFYCKLYFFKFLYKVERLIPISSAIFSLPSSVLPYLTSSFSMYFFLVSCKFISSHVSFLYDIFSGMLSNDNILDVSIFTQYSITFSSSLTLPLQSYRRNLFSHHPIFPLYFY